ncbi:MAG: dihydroorotate dehydrogenase [Actinobacteria bacterium]|nr:dihydroorotate dehydrogenase [Actinomycetota bacterium]
MTRPSLAVDLAGIRLKNPVLAASGTFGAGREASGFVDIARLGGLITKSMTLEPWKGKPTPRMCETPSGMLNAIGIQNRGVAHFISEDLPWLVRRKATVIASIAGNTVDEFAGVAARLAAAGGGIAGVEVNISCPNLEDRDNMFAHSEAATARVVSEVKRALPAVPLFAKLSPNVTSVGDIAAAAVAAGADGLSLINTVLGMAIDVNTRRPKLAGTVGGLSGPAIRPIAVRAVHEVHRAHPGVPIIGQGGISSAADALEMILAGATAVAVGTANFINPRSALEVAGGLSELMASHGAATVAELVGAVELVG